MNNTVSPQEFSLKAFFIGLLVSVVLTATNVYLSLKVGLTISAAIPASVAAIILLRGFKNYSIFECNCVQAMASAGEAAVAGAVFVLPAIILIHFWTTFNFWQTVVLLLIGTLLGSLFAIPLRRIFTHSHSLPFPEGLAVATVFEVGEKIGTGFKRLIMGTLIAAVIKIFQTGFQVLVDEIEGWMTYKKIILDINIGISPALLGVGYIVGLEVACSIFMGGVFVWLIGVPIYSYFHPIDLLPSIPQVALYIWGKYLRFIGVGVMLLSGLFTLIRLSRPILQGLAQSIQTLLGQHQEIPQKTEQDISISHIMYGLLAGALLTGFFVFYFCEPMISDFSNHVGWIFVFSLLFIFLAGFIISVMACYLAGLIGVSNLPVSGLTVLCLILLTEIVMQFSRSHLSQQSLMALGAFILVISAIMASLMSAAGMHMQCLKTTQLIKASPYKQELAFLAGLIPSVFIVIPIMQLMFSAYGLAGSTRGVSGGGLPVPQATLMSSTVLGILSTDIPWGMVWLGIGLAIAVIILDEVLRRIHKGRLYPMAFGLGMLLPFSMNVPLFLGGLIAYLADRKLRQLTVPILSTEQRETKKQNGLLLACGFIAGESVAGILLAIPFALTQRADLLKWMPDQYHWIAVLLSVLVFVALVRWLYRAVVIQQCHRECMKS
jgi:putative OPT family oligopeptide transporter